MLIWVLLFLIVVGMSAILAYGSMKDLQESPKDANLAYGLYLIQKEEALTSELLDKIYQALVPIEAVIALERLLKGGRRALAIYGPVAVLRLYVGSLGLLELEDYSKREVIGELAAWEMGFKNPAKIASFTPNWTKQLPELKFSEQLWWQITLLARKNKGWQSNFRVAVLAQDKVEMSLLEEALIRVGKNADFVIFPQVYSAAQVLKLFQCRTFFPSSNTVAALNSNDLRLLLDVS